ncbi:hypothetical protein ANN_16156 [Periplaneta americana]|uniref:C2H2-type domain-containing protein n=1 Tax=Periplaneta americana TaxID=6978 RepID=A0ABQ8SI83_PERAM|nr:hypothetical protein ANN_16156 [Periplaneta americana]
MAHSGVQQEHHCKTCGLYFDSVQSLDVHLRYHKENLLIKWGNPSDETNNNNASSNKQRGGITTAPADSSDSMIKTETGRPTGGGSPQPNSYNHPPTPSSFSSAPSPFQDPSAQRFSPKTSTGYTLSERTPPQQQNGALNPYQQYGNIIPTSSEASGFFVDSGNNSGYILGSGVDFPSSSSSVDNHRISSPNSVTSPSPSSSIGPVVTSSGMYRYHPYHQPQTSTSQMYVPDRNNGVTSSGPSPSSYQPPSTPNQCDKCGFVCNSSSALMEHLSSAHPSAPSPSFINNQMRFQQESMYQNFQGNNESPDPGTPVGQQSGGGKVKDEPAAEILDLDSHKVHQVYHPEEEAAAAALRAAAGESNNRGGNPHSVSAMLWGNMQQHNPTSSTTPPGFQCVTSQEGMTVPQQQSMTYQRAGYPHHIVPVPGQVMHPHHLHHISSVPNNIPTSSLPPPGPMSSTSPHQHKNGPTMSQGSQQQGNQTWKSNEARRPKTYNCSACNKWFTSSGHLKRHYNTTLHKNAVKQSGAPDPATQPISNHHHPGRAAPDIPSSSRGTPTGESHVSQPSPVPGGLGPSLVSLAAEESSRSDDASSNGNFGRITPSLQHSSLLQPAGQQQGSPPNLMAGPSITAEAQTGGLQFLTTSNFNSENNLVHDPSSSVPPLHVGPSGFTPAAPNTSPYPPPHPSAPITSPFPTSYTTFYAPDDESRRDVFPKRTAPPHISMLPQHQQMLPDSISSNHHITISGNCNNSGGSVSPLNAQDEQQFLLSMSSSSQQDNQPLPSFAHIGNNPFVANSVNGFGGLTAVYPAASSPGYSLVSSGPTTTAVDNVGGLLNGDNITHNQHLLTTMKQSDAYNNNSFWTSNFEDQGSLLDDSNSNALPSDSNGSGGGDENISPATTPDCTTNGDHEKSLQSVIDDMKNEDDISSTGTEDISAKHTNAIDLARDRTLTSGIEGQRYNNCANQVDLWK